MKDITHPRNPRGSASIEDWVTTEAMDLTLDGLLTYLTTASPTSPALPA